MHVVPPDADVDDAGPRTEPEGHQAVVLDILHDREGAITVGELADVITRERTGAARQNLDVAGDVHEELVEHVLPALEDRELVEFDGERGVVSLPSEEGLVARILERVR